MVCENFHTVKHQLLATILGKNVLILAFNNNQRTSFRSGHSAFRTRLEYRVAIASITIADV